MLSLHLALRQVVTAACLACKVIYKGDDPSTRERGGWLVSGWSLLIISDILRRLCLSCEAGRVTHYVGKTQTFGLQVVEMPLIWISLDTKAEILVQLVVILVLCNWPTHQKWRRRESVVCAFFLEIKNLKIVAFLCSAPPIHHFTTSSAQNLPKVSTRYARYCYRLLGPIPF